MLVKKMLATGLVMMGASLPLLAIAGPDLILDNYTDQYSTTKLVHSGKCSDQFGQAGITKPQERQHKIPGTIISIACYKSQPKDCQAYVFVTSDCDKSGSSPIALVHFDPSTGINHDKGGIQLLSNSYKISETGALSLRLDRA